MIVRAKAPLRISFLGGGTDLPPYPSKKGGLVLSATINRYAFASIRPITKNIVKLNSRDLDTIVHYDLSESIPFDGRLDLISACLNRFPFGEMENDNGFEMYLESDAPAGSGLGGSSSIVVAVIGSLGEFLKFPYDSYQMAHLAWEVERKDVGIPGGMQDQYAAVFGGFNFIEFNGPEKVLVNPLRIASSTLQELEYNILLVYLGQRESKRIIEDQISGIESKGEDVQGALDSIKELAIDAKNSLLTGNLDKFGEILHQGWIEKKKTSGLVTTPRIDELYEEAKRLGTVGGKVSGAGGGGYMFLYCPYDKKPAVAKYLSNNGCEVTSINFDFDGLQTWSVQK